MKTITKEIKVFRFAELSEDAKECAKNDHASACGYSWGDEELDSIKALAAHFGGEVEDYNIDWFETSYSSMSFDMPTDMPKAEIRQRLLALGSYNRKTLKGNGECKLTGYCGDENAIDGFRLAFIRGKVTDLDELMQAAFDSWIKAAHEDCAYQFSDEAFGETCEANDYEFTEDGRLYR